MSEIYIAFYKGHKTVKKPFDIVAKFSDWLTRKLTKGLYSHCEIAIRSNPNSNVYCCYSSSVRDGGVRSKLINLNDGKWDLIPVKITENEIRIFFEKNKSKGYDFFGALGVVFNTKQNRNKYFCSEFVAELLGFNEAWRFSPNDLAAIFHN